MIRPTFLGFETAKRALSIAQSGLDTVGHNISNAQTAGYTRQRVDQVALSMNGTAQKYQVFGAASQGMGSNLQGISQIRDVYLDNRYRAEASVNGELGVKADGLTDINNIFDEMMTDGLHSKFGDLLNVIDLLSQSPDSKELAMTVRDTANQLAQLLNKNASQLEKARAEQVSDLKTSVSQDVNVILEKIADLNQKIKNDNFYGNPSNDLNDQRNLLIDQLSEYLDIKVVHTPVKVTDTLSISVLSIELNNSGTPPIKLVDGSDYNQIGVEDDPSNGNVKISVIDGISGLPIKDVTKSLTTGGLKGYIDIINGTGENIDDGFNYRGIPYYMKALDEFAVQFAEVMNRVNNITDQESQDSAKSYPPVITGDAADWLDSVTSGTVEFEGQTTKLEFELYESGGITRIRASYVEADGVSYGQDMPYNPGTTYNITNSSGDVVYSITTKDITPDASTPYTSTAIIDGGYPAIPATDGNKNLIVPVSPTVTDSTGKQPAWIESIEGKTIQFSGKGYDVEFGYNPANGDMTAKMADGSVYTGTWSANGKVEFRDASGAVMFSVKTTNTAPAAGASQVTVDATINAKNIAVSQNWFNDPLYITTSKENPSDIAKSTLYLSGTTNPTWLNKVSTGDDGVNVSNGSYQFKFDTTTTPNKVSVVINGITYQADYASNSTIELKGGEPQRVGLIIQTNSKSPTSKDAENVATIKVSTGAKSDNVLKFLTELKSSNNYEVSGIAGNFQEFLQSFQAQMALDKNLNTSKLESSLSVISGYADRRDAISAVSVDEEGINMMSYQNYYNAAARYMTVLDEALDKIINGMGSVGR